MRTLLLALTISVFTISLSAQDPMGGPPPGPPPDMFGGAGETPGVNTQVKRLTKILKLSDEQRTKVRAILQEEKAQLDKLKKDQPDSDEDALEGVDELHKATSAKIREILTEEQKTKFDEHEAKRQDARERSLQETPPPPPL
jgi:Spy/CpxP family protein refolding chaperone